MKKRSDPRHLRRIRLLKALYSLQYPQTQTASLSALDNQLLKKIISSKDRLNQQINLYSSRFGPLKMAKIDLSILQLGCFELIEQKEPHKVIIDEAIELAKEFGGSKSAALVNGILAKISESLPKSL